MGNYRFRLSDMIPNAWFYKLRDMSRSRNQNIIYHGSKKKPQHSSSSSSSNAVAAQSSKERQPYLSHQRKSYYFSRDLTAAPSDEPEPEPEHEMFYDNVATKTRISDSNYSEPPRKSSRKRRSTRRNRVSNRSSSPRVVTSSVSAGCSCRATAESLWTKPDSTPEEYPISPLDSSSENEAPSTELGSNRCVTPETFDGMLSWSASCRCRHEKDIIMDIENKPLNAKFQEPADKVDGFHTVSVLNLPPIITNPSKSSTNKTVATLPTEPTKTRAKLEERNAHGSLSVKVVKEDVLNSCPKEQKTTTPPRRFSSNSQGLKLRTNSPRIVNRRIQGRRSAPSSTSANSRRSMSDSFAVVKSSKDPQRDFRDSMVEMIVENNICASKDLEDLLACYLSLNSDEYHDLIIRVFKQIWFDVVDNHHK